MKSLKKITSAFLAVVMPLSCFAVAAFAADGKISVKLRVEGISALIFYSDVTVDENATVLDVVKAAKDLDVKVVDSYYGPYISAVNGISEKTYKGYDGWNYMVNGGIPDVGVSKYTVSKSDNVVLYYGDPFGAGMQYPEINTSDLKNGKISFTSMDTVYDDNWNPITKECPVKDYTLTWGYGNGKTVTLTPDENGVCTIAKEYLKGSKHSVQIERYAENGCPTVLRYAPDFTVSVSTSTIADFVSGIFSTIKTLFETVINFIKSLFTK